MSDENSLTPEQRERLERLEPVWELNDQKSREIRERISEQSKGINFLRKDKIGLKEEQKSGDIRKLIKKWLEVSERVLSHSQDSERSDKNLERIKKFFHKNFVPTLETFPIEEYSRVQINAAEQLGHGRNHHISNEQIEIEIENIKESLDKWIEYFTSKDSSSTPIWAKYWAFMGLVKMSGQEIINPTTNEIKYPKREKNTISGYPELNREALALATEHITKLVEEGINLNEALSNTNFNDVYTFYLNTLRSENYIEELEITEGTWVKYNQGEDTKVLNKLVNSLDGKNTGWCTAGRSTAELQLKGGDFYVYYTDSKTGRPNPRIAIRMQKNKIAEVRGIAENQNLDEVISGTSILENKLSEMGTVGEEYKKKSENMRRVTEIYNSLRNDFEYQLSEDDLNFLFSKPEGFGYDQDPRIKEILAFSSLKTKYNLTQIDSDSIEILISSNEVRNTISSLPFIDPKLYNFIADKIIESGEGIHVANNLGKFTGINHTNIAYKLVDSNFTHVLASSLGKFKDLPTALILEIIEEGYGEAVAFNINRYNDDDHLRISEALIESNNIIPLIDNLDKFSGLNQLDVANKAINKDYGWYLAEKLEKFKGLDSSIANKLIEEGYSENVINELKSFTGLDMEIANRLIEMGVGVRVVFNLDQFTNIDFEKIIDKLIEEGSSRAVIENLQKFTGVNELDIANKLINANQINVIITYFSKFSGENQLEIAIKLVESTEKWPISYNLKKFNGVSQKQIADKLIETGHGNIISYNLEKYSELNHLEIANKLIDNKLGLGVVINLKKFNEDIHAGIADKFINTKRGTTFLASLEKFSNLNHTEVANKLIKSGQAETVVRFLDKFKGLNTSIASKLIEGGFITKEELVKNYRSSFA